MGYDSHEDITFEVAKYSIESRSSVPVDIVPLKRKELQVMNAWHRPIVAAARGRARSHNSGR